MINLFDDSSDAARPRHVKPWRPVPLNREQWPPNYSAVYAWRMQQLIALRSDPSLVKAAKAYYAANRIEFIMHWLDTYNPRLTGNKWVPFVLFQRQYEFGQFYESLRREQQNGLVEKCRDMGATWLVCGLTLADWLFENDVAVGWGSRKQDLVDKIGDSDSIFEKIRLMLRRMPDVFLPEGFKFRDHATFMKLLNPENGASITGESGDNIGRGGRKSIYLKDESAHWERAEKIQAALDDNTNVQLDISSVNGLGNVFHRKREAGIDWKPGLIIPSGYTRVFVFDWRENPMKDQEWYERRKAAAIREGLQHIFAQEVERNYSAAISNTIIDYEHIEACVDAHLKLECFNVPMPERYIAGLDVADGGHDRNALAIRQWVILRKLEEWGGVDTAVTTARAIQTLRDYHGIVVEYDCIGIGSGVKAEFNRLQRENNIPFGSIDFVPWNAGGAVIEPYKRIIEDDDKSLLNRDFYGNFKAQAWWSLRTRVYKTWRAVTFGDIYPVDELISFDSVGLGHMLAPLKKELAQPVRGYGQGLKMIVDKAPEGTRSPNLADAVVQSFFPAPDNSGGITVGNF